MRYNTLHKLTVVALSLLAMGACTNVDDMLGLDFVPDDQQTKVEIAEFQGVQAFLSQTDSIPSNNLGVVFFGYTKNATFGSTLAKPLLQFAPGGFADKDNRFGFNPVADSMKIYLQLSAFVGEHTEETEFLVYGVKTDFKIRKDSLYYPNFLEKFGADKILDKELFSFEYTDTTSNYVMLTPTEEGSKFMTALVTAGNDKEDDTYSSDTLFHNKFRGLIIVPKTESSTKQIYRASLENSHMVLYTHNYDKEAPTEVKDTLKISYYFDDTQYSRNSSLNSIVHNYTGSSIDESIIIREPATNKETVPEGKLVSKGYIQTLAGVNTTVIFTDDLRNAILAKKVQLNAGGVYKSIAINRAEIHFYLDTPTATEMNAAPSRLGMYYNYAKLTTFPDYNYASESQGATLPYGGYINRSNGYYSMDITAYIQKLLTDSETQRKVVLAPEVPGTYGFGEVVINTPKVAGNPLNPKEQPIKIHLTYTLIK